MKATVALIGELRRDNTSGAARLAVNAWKILQGLFRRVEEERFKPLRRWVIKIAKMLISAQPTMAPIINMCNSILLASEESRTTRDLKERALDIIAEGLSAQERHHEAIVEEASGLVQAGDVIITHSYSTTVADALIRARSRGKKFRVICSEARPCLEGVDAARELAKHGIDGRLVIDAALQNYLHDATRVMIGCDAVMQDVVVNKIGTFGLALSAEARATQAGCGIASRQG